MKWSSNSGSLLSLSQWLHTHSCSGPSPCCPLSAGLGFPSLMRKTCGRDSPTRKCLKSWTGGKSILSIEMRRRRGWGGGWGGGEEDGGLREDASREILGCNLLWCFFLLLTPPHPTLPGSQPAKWRLQPRWSGCQRERDRRASPALCVCVSVGDCIRRSSSITDGAVVCTVALVWEQEVVNKVGAARLQERYKDREGEWR